MAVITARDLHVAMAVVNPVAALLVAAIVAVVLFLVPAVAVVVAASVVAVAEVVALAVAAVVEVPVVVVAVVVVSAAAEEDSLQAILYFRGALPPFLLTKNLAFQPISLSF